MAWLQELKNDLFVLRELYLYGAYDVPPDQDGLFLDFGANKGFVSAKWKRENKQRLVIAFEPVTDYFRVCRRRGRKKGFCALEMAVVPNEKTCFVIEDGLNSRITDNEIAGLYPTHTTTLSEEIKACFDLPLIVKLDIEGLELPVLREARRQLHKVKWLFVEIHNGNDIKPIIDLISKTHEIMGFRANSVLVAKRKE